MTKLLEQALAKAAALPEDEQDALAREILDVLEGDRRWNRLFEQTTDEQWSRMAQEVRHTIEAGETVSRKDFLG